MHILCTITLLFLSISLLTEPLLAQDADSTSNCTTDSLVISTGWNRISDTSETWHNTDPHWRIIHIDVNPKPTSLETEQATIIPFQRKIPLGESRWINRSGLFVGVKDGT